MDVILVIAVTWLFLLLLAFAILRTAGRAERAAEQAALAPRAPRRATEHRNHVTTAVVVAAALPFAGAGVAAPDADAQSCRGARAFAPSTARSATVCLINRERHARGLAPLSTNVRLSRAANRHAADMVARGYFAHVSPEGIGFSERLRRAGYARGCTAWAGGETLAWGVGTGATPASRVRAWMNSPGHRTILLDRGYREIGIAIRFGSPGKPKLGATYVGEFGRRIC